MKKNITLSDIAKLCGCSSATVSYVLNGRNDQRISEETKQKILQMANLYQYRINPYAKSLATGELHNILFYYDECSFSLAKSEILNFINKLSIFLKENHYNLIIAPNNEIMTYNYVDAILTYKISKEKFKLLGNKNFVPLISIDCFLHDNIFFEVINNFDELENNSNITYLSLKYNDEEMNELLKNKVNVKFISSYEELDTIVNLNNSKLISLSYEMKKYLESKNINIDYKCIDNPNKFEAILEAIKLSTSREAHSHHQYLV